MVQHTGSSVNPQRQKEPHAHAIVLDPANRFAYVADLGLDKVLVYQFDGRNGLLTLNNPPSASVKPGAGPRHLAIHPTGRYAYVINEMNCTITAFNNDSAKGALQEAQTISTLPAGQAMQSGFSGAEIEVHPSGKFLYASNRGHDSIAVFGIDLNTGRLTYVANTPTQGSTRAGSVSIRTATISSRQPALELRRRVRINPQSGKLTRPAARSTWAHRSRSSLCDEVADTEVTG